ncbi:MAG TPA: CsbD family protein, partial [Gemmatimonadaceae bacterium]|nr:CsbD family protein [Gemmatimonadaceae bacterium]
KSQASHSDIRGHVACSIQGVVRMDGQRTRLNFERCHMKDLNQRGTENEAEGTAKEMKGNIRKNVGDATDNESQQLKGSAEELAGKAQKNFGKVERKLDPDNS